MLIGIEGNWDSSSLKKHWDELVLGYVEEIYYVFLFVLFLVE